MTSTRREKDALGEVEVASDRLWGAQTQRSLQLFRAGGDRFRMDIGLIRALARSKRVAAQVNAELGEIDSGICDLIVAAATEVLQGQHDTEFPLVVFQTGSGTQSNMNVNEVIANRANQLAGQPLGTKSPVHPNDHVNRSQSSNDIFPVAMHIAVVEAFHAHLESALNDLVDAFGVLEKRHATLVKSGRTHLQDATPITLGQEISGWRSQLEAAGSRLNASLEPLHELAIGGTAVGTGLNSPAGFADKFCERLAAETGTGWTPMRNRFAGMAAHDALVDFSAALRTLAVAAMKIANDVRWLASGPRCGLGELRLPENEPGSSIMPGKVNPTQCEALTMVCSQVFGNDATVALAGSQGNFELNVYKPVIVHNVLESIHLLGSSLESFNRNCVAGIEPDTKRIGHDLARNLMLVTALVPHIGYESSAAIAQRAQRENLSLRDAAIASGEITATQFDQWIDPIAMTGPRGGK